MGKPEHANTDLGQSQHTLLVKPSTLSGSLSLPPSKSHSMRWLVLASMDNTPTRIEMSEIGRDVNSMIKCLIKLGCFWDGSVFKGSELLETSQLLDCENSGTALRFLIAQAATCDHEITFDGDHSLRARTSMPLLESLGVEFNRFSQNAEYPLSLKGPFAKDVVVVDVSKTSQYHSAILLMTPRTNGFEIKTVGEAVSRKHSELTWDLCKLTGAKNLGEPWKVVCPDVSVPSDASMAAFAKLANLPVKNPPSPNDMIGHNLDVTNLRDSNDLITPMAAWLALHGGGEISGAKHAEYKESDRISKTSHLLAQFGIKSKVTDEGLKIEGNQIPTRPNQIVDTFGDHRIQMTAILLASICGGEIDNGKLHEIAWPSFLEQLIECGLKVA